MIFLVALAPVYAATSVSGLSQVGIDDTSDSDNVIDTTAGAGDAATLYWAADILCDGTDSNCGWDDVPLGSGAANHPMIWSGSNDVTYDNGQLYWDAADDRLGIGNSGPDSTMHVTGGVCVSVDGTCTDMNAGEIEIYNMTTPSGGLKPHIILDSTTSGDTWTDQGAYIVLGESPTAAAALYLSYIGNGWSYLGSGGGVNGASGDGIPDDSYFAFDYNDDVITTPDNIGIGDSSPDAALMVVGGVCIESGTTCTDPGDGSLYVEELVEIHGVTTGDAADLNISDNDAIMSLGVGQSGTHGFVFGDPSADQGMHMVYRTGDNAIYFEQGDTTADGSNILSIDSDTGHVGIGVDSNSEDTELHVLGSFCAASGDTCTDHGAGNMHIVNGYIYGANGEYIRLGSAIDSWTQFYGGSGTDDTDFLLDLDGSYPEFGSGTDNQLGIAETVNVLGALDAADDVDWDGELQPDAATCANGQGVRRTGSNNWDCVTLADGSGSAGHIGYWSDTDTITYDNGQLYWDATSNLLGLGTSSPDYSVHVLETATPQMSIDYDASNTFDYLVTSSGTYFSIDGSTAMYYSQSSGNLGIGTSGQDADVHVLGDACFDDDDICTGPGNGAITMTGDLYLEGASSVISFGPGTAGAHGFVFGDDSGGNQAQAIYRSSPNTFIFEKTSGTDMMNIDVDGASPRWHISAEENGVNTGLFINGDSADPDTAIYIDDVGTHGFAIEGTPNTGVYINGATTYGIYARNTDNSGNEFGVRGYNNAGTTGYGGHFSSVGATTNRGVYGSAGSTAQCSFYTPDSTGGYCSGSSYRWKRNIATLEDAVETLKDTRGVTFNIDNFDEEEFGFIAEEFYRVYPFATDVDGNGEPNSLDANAVLPVLVEVTKDQQEQLNHVTKNYDDDTLYFAGNSLSAQGQGVTQPHSVDPAQQVTYFTQVGSQPGTIIRGTATLSNGNAQVSLPNHFAQMSQGSDVIVSLTPQSSDSLGLAVTSADSTQFTVQELQGGTGSYQFAFTVRGVKKYVPTSAQNTHFKPRNGYDTKFADRNAQPPIQGLLISNGILDSDGNAVDSTLRSINSRAPITEPRPWDTTPENPADTSTFTNDGIHPADYYSSLFEEEPEEDVDSYTQFDKEFYEGLRGTTVGILDEWNQIAEEKKQVKEGLQ